jgi:hypothetical protein
MEPDQRISCITTFTFIRLETRHYQRAIVNWVRTSSFSNEPPAAWPAPRLVSVSSCTR